MEILVESLKALWQVTLVGLLLGAGLPALFALGMRSLSTGRLDGPDGQHAPTSATTSPLARLVGYLCFGLVVAAALFGIVVIVFGKQLFG